MTDDVVVPCWIYPEENMTTVIVEAITGDDYPSQYLPVDVPASLLAKYEEAELNLRKIRDKITGQCGQSEYDPDYFDKLQAWDEANLPPKPIYPDPPGVWADYIDDVRKEMTDAP